MRIKLTIEYNGAYFYGWQFQKDFQTVQGTFEKCIGELLQRKVRLTGASRTDRGVHALNQVAHFDIEEEILYNKFKNLRHFQHSMNSVLPDTIYIKEIEETSKDFHARFSAKSKKYIYKIFLGKSPLKKGLYWEYPYPLNTRPLYRMAKLLIGKKEMSRWAVGRKTEGWVKIIECKWKKKKEKLIFKIQADRFLNKLIRSLVGQMVFLSSKGDYEKFEKYLKEGPEKIILAPAYGLYLQKVYY